MKVFRLIGGVMVGSCWGCSAVYAFNDSLSYSLGWLVIGLFIAFPVIMSQIWKE